MGVSWILRRENYSLTENVFCFTLVNKTKNTLKQGNRRDMRKIYVTRQFFEVSAGQGHFSKQQKSRF